MRTRRLPSAILVLGALSGLLSALLCMAIAIPMVVFAVEQEERNATVLSARATNSIEAGIRSGEVLSPAYAAEQGVDWIAVSLRDPEEILFATGHPRAVELAEAACGSEQKLLRAGSDTWATDCRLTATHRITVGVRPVYQVGREVLKWIGVLSIMVGIVTALGQARVLRPLSEMSDALERVGRGERSVRMKSTGLAELDVVVDRINEAAHQMAEREDAITARITVVQEMARMVAHEIRNPLQSLDLLTTLVGDEEDPEERRLLAGQIHNEIRVLDQVVHRLLREGASRGALRLHRAPTSVTRLVEEATALHRPVATRRGVRLSLGLVSQVVSKVDGAMLRRSIENLITNALQAVSDRTGEIRLSVVREGQEVQILVDDNGPGVSAELGDTIFEVSVTGHDRGHGLGLALVRAVMVAHEGTIEYTKSPLGGARFRARIPIDDSEDSDD